MPLDTAVLTPPPSTYLANHSDEPHSIETLDVVSRHPIPSTRGTWLARAGDRGS